MREIKHEERVQQSDLNRVYNVQIPGYEPQQTDKTEISYGVKRMLRKKIHMSNNYMFWQDTYEFVRICTRDSLHVGNIVKMWSIHWFDCQTDRNHKRPTYASLHKFQQKLIGIIQDWIEKREEDLYYCSKCDSYKTRDQFHKDSHRVANIASKCKACAAEAYRAKREGREPVFGGEGRGKVLVTRKSLRRKARAAISTVVQEDRQEVVKVERAIASMIDIVTEELEEKIGDSVEGGGSYNYCQDGYLRGFSVGRDEVRYYLTSEFVNQCHKILTVGKSVKGLVDETLKHMRSIDWNLHIQAEDFWRCLLNVYLETMFDRTEESVERHFFVKKLPKNVGSGVCYYGERLIY